MEALMSAIRAGDYARAYDTLRYTSKAATPAGAAIGAFLLAMLEQFDEAEQLARATTVEGIDTIVRGERERAVRWRDPAAGELRVASETPAAGLYAAMGAAFAQRDAELAERTQAELAALARPVAGTLTFVNGQTRAFRDLADADDAIGRMLETYGRDGLMYLPFEGLHRIAARPRKNFIDDLMPQIEVSDAHGTRLVYVPLLYAGSATASMDQLRNGRATIFEYLGTAKRGRGQRDFRVDDALVGLQNVAAIEFTAS